MMERMKKAREHEGGFTLIELLVVIVILGILAAVVVFAVGGVGDKGQSSACVIDTRTIRTAEEAFYASPSGGAYTTEAALQTGGFLSEQSTLHEIVQDPDPDGAGPLLAGFHLTEQTTKCGGAIGATVNGTTSL
jgi:prepilin-type N-terminal cleavage/methylation domain-containing protein